LPWPRGQISIDLSQQSDLAESNPYELLLIRRLGEGDKLAGPDVSFFGRRLVGHQQVTDAYLLALALRRGGVLVTFDGGVAALLEPKSPNAKFLEVLKP